MSRYANPDPEVLHLGCGEDYREGEVNVDAVAEVEPDVLVDLDDYPWPWEDGSFSVIRAYHVFEHLEDVEMALRECARILVSDGTLITRWPVGLDAVADPDHEHMWTWRTPEFYTGKRHWDRDVGLEVTDRSVDLWPAGQDNVLAVWDKLLWEARFRLEGAGPWCFNQPSSCGEFEVVFRKP